MTMSSFIRRTIICFFLGTSVTFSAITVDINSGNPASPFPQFQPYVNPTDTLYNLATHNPVGVPHAEMEKSIREAYQIMMNRAEKTGETFEGVDYIRYLSNPQCSEGDGYGLLGAAAMADKTTFDGMWLYIHDFRMNKVKRYIDCGENSPDHAYSQLPGWDDLGSSSAADGDFDIALALLQAHKQWGEFMGIDDACGNPISYKQAAIDFLKALTDTLAFAANGNILSGDIGIDGYVKGGDAWAELSGWSTSENLAQMGISEEVGQPGPVYQYFDYFAPAYFHQFADFLAEEDSAACAWNIYQFRRAAASSDWLMGQLYNADPKNIPICGQVSLTESTATATFNNFNESEDIRLPWRTVLNRVWNGNPVFSWDPETHQVETGVSNTFEQDIGIRFARFLWDARQEPWGNECVQAPGISPYQYWGPSVLSVSTAIDGGGTHSSVFSLNWIHGVGSPSAIVAQDFNLMAEMYRQCEIEFAVNEPGDDYLTTVPYYFHGWFRLLGMLILSGNYKSPSQIKPAANMKIYCDVDKTCASAVDTIQLTITYRNYGAADAQDVVITDQLPQGVSYIYSTGDGRYDNASGVVTWNIGTVPGFKTATGNVPTTGEVSIKVLVSDATQRQSVNTATITCTNGTGWTSNQYPNKVSATLKRNIIDIIPHLSEETSQNGIIPPLHGGRSGIHFSCWFGNNTQSTTIRTIGLRLFNDAQEPYIDYGNYRISIFLYDEENQCLAGSEACENGWNIQLVIAEGVVRENVKVLHERLIPGAINGKRWNQRLIIQFSDPEDTNRTENLATTNIHLEEYRGIGARIHRGVRESLRLVLYLNSTSWEDVQWDNDWSWDPDATADDVSPGFPVTPDFTDPAPDNSSVPVTTWNPKHCAVAEKTVDNILIEEWDGYTWRKAFGNAPQATVAVQPQVVMQKNNLSITSVTPSRIRFNLPSDGKICLQMLDLKGRVTATLIDGFRKAGDHQVKWSDGRKSGSQVCMVQLQTGEGTVLRQMLYLH